MADKSLIEWTDATWNIITGCTLVDDGCRHCYAAHLITSWPAIGNHPSRKGLARKNAAGESKFTGEVRFNEQWLDQPLRWKKPRRIFVCAHGDLFHESVPDEWLDKVFAVMALAPHHTFQVLTKRPDRARAYLTTAEDHDRHITIDETGRAFRTPLAHIRVRSALCDLLPGAPASALNAASDWQEKHCPEGDGFLRRWPLPNVWLGTSISDQASADARIPELLATPAAVRFLSAEPLLGPVDLKFVQFDGYWINALTGDMELHGHVQRGLDWVIVGGESGPHARPMHPDWARALRDQCQVAGVPFFFKQWGEWGAGSINMSTGEPVFRAFPDFQTWVNKASTWVNGGTCLDAKGRRCTIGADMMRARDDGSFPVTILHRVGKARAGRLLDGAEWSQMPEVG